MDARGYGRAADSRRVGRVGRPLSESEKEKLRIKKANFYLS